MRIFKGQIANACAKTAPCRVSIIVPTRNRAQLLARTLAHICAQAFDAFEVIVVDDGSSEEVRATYSELWSTLDERFIRIELGHPGGAGAGPSVARNTGIDTASGDIITFCDDDDFWTGNAHLRNMVQAFDSDPDVDLYLANQAAVRCDGSVERVDWLPALSQRVRGRERSLPYGYRITLADLVKAGGFGQLNIVAARKTLAVTIGGFWTRTSYEEDRDFFWRAADAARGIVFNPDLVSQHNVPDANRQVNLSRRFSQEERWLISVMVSQHIAMSVRDASIRALCDAYEGDILRHLSRYLSSEGQHALGLRYARRALAARISLKWALYTVAMMCRNLLRGAAV